MRRLFAVAGVLAMASALTIGCGDESRLGDPTASTPDGADQMAVGGTDTPPLAVEPAEGTQLEVAAKPLQSIDVLLIETSDYDLANTQSDFSSNMTGFSFATHNLRSLGPPTLAQLQQYDTVLLWENGLLGGDLAQRTGNVVEQYVQGGGGLVIGTFYWQDRSDNRHYNQLGWGNLENIDRFTTDTVPPIRAGSEYNNDNLDAGSIVSHPLTTGLSSMSGYYHGGVVAKGGTTVLAAWSDGIPLIGVSSGECVVGISHFPTHPRYTAVSGEFYQMWENALNYTADSCSGGDPQTKDDCKKGGWEDYGFRNQGQCVRFIETGKDSRE